MKIQGHKKWIAPSEFYCTYCERPRVISCSISQLITVSFGLWKISYFSTLDCNIIKYSRWIWSYKSNHIQSKSHQDRKVFCTRMFVILHLPHLPIYKENIISSLQTSTYRLGWVWECKMKGQNRLSDSKKNVPPFQSQQRLFVIHFTQIWGLISYSENISSIS